MAKSAKPMRVLAVDALRGFVLLLMMAEIMHLYSIAQYFPFDPQTEDWNSNPEGWFWHAVKFNTTHVEWGGFSLHDLIQPAFSFLVGVSLPFSLMQREGRGQGFFWMLWHALWRSFLLIALGIFLRSQGRTATNFMFTDTLGQIGLGYTFLFLIGYAREHIQPRALAMVLPWTALGVILVGYWALFASYPLPASDFDYRTVGVSDKWRSEHSYDGFLAHWNKNTNPAMEFDRWFLNQFPRETRIRPPALAASTFGLAASPVGTAPLLAADPLFPGCTQKAFTYEGGGYATLSFIPTLGTMILGLIAGFWLRADWSKALKLAILLLAGVVGVAVGDLLEFFEICPNVKRIWTPAWTIYSAGWVFLMLAAFYLVIEVIGFWHWSFPLLVLGANSIVAYCSNNFFRRFIISNWQTHAGADTFRHFDDGGVKWEPVLLGAAVLATLWLMLYWMYRNKIFVRI